MKSSIRAKTIALEILAKMQVIEPTRSQSRSILKALRDEFGIKVVQDPKWRNYITKIDPKKDKNKYHYFVVFQSDDKKKWVAANAWGRIGYKPRVTNLGEFDEKTDAMNAAKKKWRTKINSGYQETKLP